LDQRATIANPQVLQDVAELLQVDATELEWALTSSVLAINNADGDHKRRVKDRVGSLFNRDSLAKELYKRVFDFVVDRVNASIACTEKSFRTIGLLGELWPVVDAIRLSLALS